MEKKKETKISPREVIHKELENPEIPLSKRNELRNGLNEENLDKLTDHLVTIADYVRNNKVDTLVSLGTIHHTSPYSAWREFYQALIDHRINSGHDPEKIKQDIENSLKDFKEDKNLPKSIEDYRPEISNAIVSGYRLLEEKKDSLKGRPFRETKNILMLDETTGSGGVFSYHKLLKYAFPDSNVKTMAFIKSEIAKLSIPKFEGLHLLEMEKVPFADSDILLGMGFYPGQAYERREKGIISKPNPLSEAFLQVMRDKIREKIKTRRKK
jgi:hypothetical protein